MVMRFPAKKNAGCPKSPRDFPPRKDGILYSPVGLSWDSSRPPAESVPTDVRTYGRSRDYYVTTKISRIDRLPNLLSNGAPLAGFAHRLRYYRPNDPFLNCAIINVLLVCLSQLPHKCVTYTDPVHAILEADVWVEAEAIGDFKS